MLIKKHGKTGVEDAIRNDVNSMVELLRVSWIKEIVKSKFFYRLDYAVNDKEFLIMGEWDNRADIFWRIVAYSESDLGLHLFEGADKESITKAIQRK